MGDPELRAAAERILALSETWLNSEPVPRGVRTGLVRLYDDYAALIAQAYLDLAGEKR